MFAGKQPWRLCFRLDEGTDITLLPVLRHHSWSLYLRAISITPHLKIGAKFVGARSSNGCQTILNDSPDSKVHGAIMGPTWVLSAPDGPHVDPMNLAIRECV